MFGFFIGTACLFGLFATMRHRHFGRFGYGGRWGHHGRHRQRHGGERSSWRRKFALRWLFEELDTTPGQEKVIMRSFDTLRDSVSNGRGEIDLARREVAEAIGGDVLDETVLSSALGRVDTLLTKVRSELFGALTEVHAALDGNQRRALAEMIADFHGYRLGYDRRWA
ncbi:MAG TPA: periplasmic heavy metal sensor [Polyangiales bacterium]|jgi:hypothetical protein|nr:periplasmic heavy metal sensor [Polyangiales bacterium]